MVLVFVYNRYILTQARSLQPEPTLYTVPYEIYFRFLKIILSKVTYCSCVVEYRVSWCVDDLVLHRVVCCFHFLVLMLRVACWSLCAISVLCGAFSNLDKDHIVLIFLRVLELKIYLDLRVYLECLGNALSIN